MNPKIESVSKAIKLETRERSLDVVFEVTGAPDLIPDEFEGLRSMGRFMVFSSPQGKTTFDFHDLCALIPKASSNHQLVRQIFVRSHKKLS